MRTFCVRDCVIPTFSGSTSHVGIIMCCSHRSFGCFFDRQSRYIFSIYDLYQVDNYLFHLQGAQNIIYCATDNFNTEENNPLTGYFITSLKQQKSKIEFDDEVSRGLWIKSLELCEVAGAGGEKDTE